MDKLMIGGVSAEQLVAEFGSPLYVYDENTIIEKFREIKKAFTLDNFRIHYACKANSNIEIMRLLKGEGACIDASSAGEVFLALRAGFDPDTIYLTADNVTREEMRFAVSNNVPVILGSLSNMETFGELFPGRSIGVRINTGFGAGHSEKVKTGGEKSKFGEYITKTDEILETAASHNLRITGLHEHTGSGITETEDLLTAMRHLISVAGRFPDLEFLDFGGGYGVPYRPGDKRPDLAAIGREAVKLFNEFCAGYGRTLTLAIEPGRYPVAEAGNLLAVVNTVKTNPSRRYIGLDTGFNHLVRPAMYGSYHEIVNASRPDGPAEKCDISGNLCESGDVFARDRMIAQCRPGDVVAILNAGAYGFSMASHYNLRLLPAEVLVKEGKARLIRRREKFEDLIRTQTEI